MRSLDPWPLTAEEQTHIFRVRQVRFSIRSRMGRTTAELPSSPISVVFRDRSVVVATKVRWNALSRPAHLTSAGVFGHLRVSGFGMYSLRSRAEACRRRSP